jgi:predicted nucleic acid-binding protein
MNGPTNEKLVLDSNVIINRLNKKISMLPGTDNAEKLRYIISVVTEMEALANPRDTEEDRKEIKTLLSKFTIIPFTDEIKNIAIEIRRSGSPRPKLPDAIVAATAVLLSAPLVSADDKLLKLSWPGLQTIHITSFSIS